MIKRLILLLCLVLLPAVISAQTVRITEKKIKEVIDKMEPLEVEIIEVKTLRKWKALELSSDMKPQMDYNVVRVKYKTGDTLKTLLIDMHLVPIQYSVQKTTVKTESKEDYMPLTYTE